MVLVKWFVLGFPQYKSLEAKLPMAWLFWTQGHSLQDLRQESQDIAIFYIYKLYASWYLRRQHLMLCLL